MYERRKTKATMLTKKKQNKKTVLCLVNTKLAKMERNTLTHELLHVLSTALLNINKHSTEHGIVLSSIQILNITCDHERQILHLNHFVDVSDEKSFSHNPPFLH